MMKKILIPILLFLSIASSAQVSYGWIDKTTSSVTYATWNPSDKSTLVTLSGGNLTAQMTSTASSYFVRSTIGKSSGKWYWEVQVTANPSNFALMPGGISQASENINDWFGQTAGVSWTYDGGQFYENGTPTTNPGVWSPGEVLGIALDLTSGSENVKFYKNGVLWYTATIAAGTWYAATGSYQTLGTTVTNFGATAFFYSPSAGYNAGLY